MIDPDELDAAAEGLEALGAAEDAETLRRSAAIVRRMRGLAVRLTAKQLHATNDGMQVAQRRALSEKLLPAGDDPNMDAARAVGIPSLRKLAQRLGCTGSFLSQVRAGSRPMPGDMAAKFRKITGKDWK